MSTQEGRENKSRITSFLFCGLSRRGGDGTNETEREPERRDVRSLVGYAIGWSLTSLWTKSGGFDAGRTRFALIVIIIAYDNIN